jgi:hypothetical protein
VTAVDAGNDAIDFVERTRVLLIQPISPDTRLCRYFLPKPTADHAQRISWGFLC